MKTFTSCELVVSAPDALSWPESSLPEIVLAGRSNVGKSSFINTITNRKKLAYVGNTPGKTRLLNFFNIDDEFMFVDVPGYGYANASRVQLKKFGEMMEEYFLKREQRIALVLLIDSRHNPTEDDILMLDFARYHEMKVIVIATKFDKLKNSEQHRKLTKISETLTIAMDDIIPFSSVKRLGVEDAQQAIYHLLD